MQKKVLIMTVIEAFKQYKTENPTVKNGKSKYASLRQKHIVPISENNQSVYCCIYHEK